MQNNTKTRTVQIDDEVYHRVLAISNIINPNSDIDLHDDKKVSMVLNDMVNEHYKNHMIDNLLF